MLVHLMYMRFKICGVRCQEFYVIKPVSVTCSNIIFTEMSTHPDHHAIQSFLLADFYLWQTATYRANIAIDFHHNTYLTCSVSLIIRKFLYTICSHCWFNYEHTCYSYWKDLRDYIVQRHVCIAGRCYKQLPADNLTWWQAHRRCHSIRSHLISINSFEEQRVLTWILRDAFTARLDAIHHECIYLGTIIQERNVKYSYHM